MADAGEWYAGVDARCIMETIRQTYPSLMDWGENPESIFAEGSFPPPTTRK